MKKIRLLLLIIIAMMGIMALSACSLPQLSKPRGLRYSDDSSKLEWLAVEGARSYVIEINNLDTGDTYEEASRSASFDLVSYASGNYTIRVKASGDKYNNGDSIWSDPIKIKRYYQSGLNLRLIESGTAYEITGIGTASDNLVIPSDYRDIPITKVGDGAFNNSTRLKSVVMPETITTIGDRAFRNCSDLESVTFSDNITSIGKNAFQGCSSLVRVTLPDELITLSDSAFAYCTKLIEVNFNDKLTSIGELAFRGVPATEITLSDSVRTIGKSAFAYCTKLQIFNMGKNVTFIGSEAFRRCTSLVSIYWDGPDWKSKVNTIDAYAFLECSALEDIRIPDSVVTIGAYAFSQCTALNSAKLGLGLINLGRNAFENTGIWLKTNADESPIVYVDGWAVGCKRFDEGTLVIRDNIFGIASYAFHTTLVVNKEGEYTKYNELQNITIPDSVKYIGTNAFTYCVKLKNVYGCKNVEVIDEYAFNGCEELQTVELGEKLRIMGNYAFAGCTKLGIPSLTNDTNQLQDVHIPETLETMGMNPFEDTHIWKMYEGKVAYAGGWVIGLNGVGGEENITIDSTTRDDAGWNEVVRGIANYALSGANMKTVDLPATIKYIGNMAFGNCSNLESIYVGGGIESTLPSSGDLKVISDHAFFNCAKLDVKIPSNITYIGTAAFYHCSSLKAGGDLDLSGVTYIGDSAFAGTEAVVDVTLSDDLTYLGTRAFAGSGLETIEIPASLTTIRDHAFFNCPYLREVVIVNEVVDGEVKGVTTIEPYAFSVSKAITSIVIPSSVKTIGDYAFRNCTGLTTITFEEGVERFGNSTFAACENLKNLNLPESLKAIGNLCFRGCTSLGSVVLRSHIEDMGMHVFFGCNPVPEVDDEDEEAEDEDEEPEEEVIEIKGVFTIYTDMDSVPEGWSIRWNTARCPIIFGCVLAKDNYGAYYVDSFVKDSNKMANIDSKSFADVPTRTGYVCIGFSTVQNGAVEYESVELSEVADGVTLYPIWVADYN